MTTPSRFTRAGLAATLMGVLGIGLLACAAPRAGRTFESPTAHALPEGDPTSRGTVQGPRLLSETEQVAVRLGRGPDGKVVLLQVLSPGLTAQQEEALRRAFEAGEWQREAPLAPASESWIENLVRARR
jgi:hypothetical protein